MDLKVLRRLVSQYGPEFLEVMVPQASRNIDQQRDITLGVQDALRELGGSKDSPDKQLSFKFFGNVLGRDSKGKVVGIDPYKPSRRTGISRINPDEIVEFPLPHWGNRAGESLKITHRDLHNHPHYSIHSPEALVEQFSNQAFKEGMHGLNRNQLEIRTPIVDYLPDTTPVLPPGVRGGEISPYAAIKPYSAITPSPGGAVVSSPGGSITRNALTSTLTNLRDRDNAQRLIDAAAISIGLDTVNRQRERIKEENLVEARANAGLSTPVEAGVPPVSSEDLTNAYVADNAALIAAAVARLTNNEALTEMVVRNPRLGYDFLKDTALDLGVASEGVEIPDVGPLVSEYASQQMPTERTLVTTTSLGSDLPQNVDVNSDAYARNETDIAGVTTPQVQEQLTRIPVNRMQGILTPLQQKLGSIASQPGTQFVGVNSQWVGRDGRVFAPLAGN